MSEMSLSLFQVSQAVQLMRSGARSALVIGRTEAVCDRAVLWLSVNMVARHGVFRTPGALAVNFAPADETLLRIHPRMRLIEWSVMTAFARELSRSVKTSS